ncbi:hypothetical protein FB45DRAFT_899929 [Roridomyces roridus]|uniref:B box-type domain-containing protein n=1 Tax=Roridomyces roridus TaxID=1738132 RepID=A0AAD7C7J1_9AGAR|nr:hypothetical protein FB45DRAFT_899929 [Roridomyces roridus]
MTTRDTRPLPKRRRLNPLPATSEPQKQLSTTKPVASVCASCHRAGQVLICPRCSAASCNVCSRTCDASIASSPPTPHLSWSPVSSPAHSPRRAALALNAANTNTDASSPPKRKKPREEEEHDGGDGCGRKLCRDCCIESLQEGTTTCYDCYGR